MNGRLVAGKTQNYVTINDIKVREWLPYIGPLAKVIRLKLFLDIVWLYPVLPRTLLARCVDVF